MLTLTLLILILTRLVNGVGRAVRVPLASAGVARRGTACFPRPFLLESLVLYKLPQTTAPQILVL